MKNSSGLNFLIRNIFCIGRNYAEHAKELKNEIPSEPVVFTKPTSALVFNNESIILPAISKNVHHELEVVVAIGRKVKNESPEEALSAIHAIALGIDVTARDLQDQLKAKSLPWTMAKGLDTFAALSTFQIISNPTTKDWNSIEIELFINGELRQKGITSDMLFSIPTLISFLSHRFTLDVGDIIYTGTPQGVGPLSPGDQLESHLKFFGQKLDWQTSVL